MLTMGEILDLPVKEILRLLANLTLPSRRANKV